MTDAPTKPPGGHDHHGRRTDRDDDDRPARARADDRAEDDGSAEDDDRRHDGERSASALDDELDREELRRRYYGLLEELRVVLPGTQILVAFLLAVPFASRFNELSELMRDTFGVALASGIAAVLFLMSPTAMHRVGVRRSRSERLVWAIRMSRIGLVLLAVSLVCVATVVAGLVFGQVTGVVAGAVTAAVAVSLWVVLPLTAIRPPGKR